jgi:hypothetical protein
MERPQVRQSWIVRVVRATGTESTAVEQFHDLVVYLPAQTQGIISIADQTTFPSQPDRSLAHTATI